MKKYEKPVLSVMSFETKEDIALKEYYYTAKADVGSSEYQVSLFNLS